MSAFNWWRRWPQSRRTQTLIGAGFLGILALLSVAAFVLPPLMVSSADVPNTVDRLAAQNAVRATLIQSLAGLALLGGAALTAVFSARTIRLNREGQITDRFTKAIDQLGDDKLDVRLGGIYALERIAQESQRDHWPIMDVLTAFLRAHASEVDFDRATSGERVPIRDRKRVRGADVQAAIRVIGRREWIDTERDRLDLWRADLRELDLRGAHLDEANLFAARLDGADLSGAHLKRADLEFAHLEGATLTRAQLQGAVLSGAHLEGASFQLAHMEAASLEEAHLERANSLGANMERAQLIGAHLQGAFLVWVRLDEADLYRADLEGAELMECHLEGANLEGANLSGANLEEGDFPSDREEARMKGEELPVDRPEGVELPPQRPGVQLWKGADEDFEEARLLGWRIPGAHLDGARADARTRWPQGFDPAKAHVIVK